MWKSFREGYNSTQRSIAVFECDSKDAYMISQIFLELFGKDKLVGELWKTMKMDENSLSSPEIHQFWNYNTSILKGQKLHLLTIMEYVRKQDSSKKERRRLFFMNYEYTVLSENNYGVMQQELNSYGRYGWKLVNVVWDNDNACLVAVMMREK